MTKARTGAGKAPAPKRVDTRQDSDRASKKLTLRLPVATAAKLERLAKARNSARVTVVCDLIDEAT